jgi:methyl-accepting chemotaxis protein
MKDNNSNQKQSSQEDLVHRWTANETVEAIQNVSKNIREYSSKMRETMKTLRESGAIPEMVDAIREASFAVRDTVNDINETTKELKRKGAVVETASAIENTLKFAEASAATVKEIATDAGKASPHTTKAIHDGVDIVKKKTSHVTGIVIKDLKNKVGAK